MAGDTIAAIATPPGRGGVGIIRLSGPMALEIALSVCPLDTVKPRYAHYTRFNDAAGGVIDDGLLLHFPAPASFTGEDVIEFQGHGGPVVMDLLLARVLELGARAARPGEFSERAYLNGRMDLAQAEAIADLIDSGTTEAARAARRSLSGEFSARVHRLVADVTELRVYVEAAIDFPEEEVDFLGDGKVLWALDALADTLGAIHAGAHQGVLLRDGVTVVIMGRPNAGKSSLLNALAEYEAAIVTSIAGTTRDPLRERIQIGGVPLHVVDTAGVRETNDPVEREGVRRAMRELEQADLALLIVDASLGWTEEDRRLYESFPDDVEAALVINKTDIAEVEEGLYPDIPWIALSAKTGEGMDALHGHILERIGRQPGSGDSYSARRRHLDALKRAGAYLNAAREQLTMHAAGELVAQELQSMQHCLGEITGVVTPDDLLGEIFSTFCIGK